MEVVDAIPEEMTEEEVLDVIQDFVNTSKRVISAGGDVVEIHCAHGYLLDQFFSDVVNPTHRSIGWIDLNRARLVLEVVTAAADAIGAQRVGLRLSPYAAFQGAGKGDIYCQYLYVVRKLKDMAVPLAYLSLVEAAGDPGRCCSAARRSIRRGRWTLFLRPGITGLLLLWREGTNLRRRRGL
jgi:NADPH2 dehydrogenase